MRITQRGCQEARVRPRAVTRLSFQVKTNLRAPVLGEIRGDRVHGWERFRALSARCESPIVISYHPCVQEACKRVTGRHPARGAWTAEKRTRRKPRRKVNEKRTPLYFFSKPRRLLARKAVWLSGGAPVVDKKGKGALRVLDAPTLDTDTLACRARPSTRARHSPATADP